MDKKKSNASRRVFDRPISHRDKVMETKAGKLRSEYDMDVLEILGEHMDHTFLDEWNPMNLHETIEE